MVTIAIQTEEAILNTLKEMAQQQQTTVEEITQEALRQYLQSHPVNAKPYSFIGIGHSGKGNISSQVESTLTQATNRQEGWSLA